MILLIIALLLLLLLLVVSLSCGCWGLTVALVVSWILTVASVVITLVIIALVIALVVALAVRLRLQKHGMDNMGVLLDKFEKMTTSASVISCSTHLKERSLTLYLGLAVATIASTTTLAVRSLAVVRVVASRLLVAVVTSTAA